MRRLQTDGYTVLAPPTPLRSLSGDSAYLRTFLETVDGPIVLVGHSYGASVITNASTGDPDIRALVYVNGSVPAEGETVAELAGPDSALSVSDPTTIFEFVPATLPPTAESDVYLKKSTFLQSFATGLSKGEAKALWATQRPITLGALNEPSGTPAGTPSPAGTWSAPRTWSSRRARSAPWRQGGIDRRAVQGRPSRSAHRPGARSSAPSNDAARATR